MQNRNSQKLRAGKYVIQAGGYQAFYPNALPPDPEIKIDHKLADLLSKANRSLGRLDGSTQILPNPDIFVAMYVRKEAILSSQIEGTQASLEDVLAYEAISERRRLSKTVMEVVNHINAMNRGTELLESLPIGVELLKELHAILLQGVRGGASLPGELRKIQNWIGPPGSDYFTAVFVPPPPTEVNRLMSELELYTSDINTIPILIKAGLIHAQFETIHPFLDGNGRLGRLLVTLYLCKRQVIAHPLLYLSAYYKQHRAEYYDRLQRVRDLGDWEGWLNFFLRGIWEVSEEAFANAQKIIGMREEHRQLILQKLSSATKCLILLDRLFEMPMTDIPSVAERLDISYPAASKIVSDLSKNGLLEEITGQKRNRLFVYEPYLAILRKGTEPIGTPP